MDQKPSFKELEEEWENDVTLPNPRFPRLVRDLLNNGLLVALLEEHYPENLEREWDFLDNGVVAFACSAMELGCTLPRRFLELVKTNYHRLKLEGEAQNQIRQACDEYVNGKPYNFQSLRLIRTNGESGGSTRRLGHEPPGLEPESAPILEEHFLRFAPDTCANCGSTAGYKTPGLKRCAGCKTTLYCFEGCQKWHWIRHRLYCPSE